MLKRNWLFLGLLILLVGLLALGAAGCSQQKTPAAAQEGANSPAPEAKSDWPNKAITIVCHTGPGAMDTAARQVSALLEPILGQPVVIENHPGGSGATAMAFASSRPADGYTFMTATGSTSFAIASGEIDFNEDDFTWIRSFQGEPTAIAVLKDSPLKTMDDFVKAMKEDPNKYVVGGYASAGFHQYMYYKLQKMCGFTSSWIPFESGGDVPINILGGHIDVGFMTPSSSVSQVKSGEIRLLAISSEERSQYFPDVPTFKESGYDLSGILWRGITAPKGTPQEVIDKFNEAMDKVVQDPKWKEYMTTTLQEPDDTKGDALTKLVKEEVSERAEFLKSLNQ